MINLIVDDRETTINESVKVFKDSVDENDKPDEIILTVTDEGIIIDVLQDNETGDSVVTRTAWLDWDDLKEMAH